MSLSDVVRANSTWHLFVNLDRMGLESKGSAAQKIANTWAEQRAKHFKKIYIKDAGRKCWQSAAQLFRNPYLGVKILGKAFLGIWVLGCFWYRGPPKALRVLSWMLGRGFLISWLNDYNDQCLKAHASRLKAHGSWTRKVWRQGVMSLEPWTTKHW